MRALNVLLSIVVSIVLALAVFEVGLRLLGMGPQPTINRFDPDLGWSKTPSSKAERKTREFDVTYEINSLGLRGDEMPSPAKPEGTYRVLMLGDSFVLGYTVDRRDLFVDQLERWWRAEGRKVDVINAGTEGYSTDQEVLWLALHGKEFKPDLVLLFPYDNDLYWNSQTKYLRFPKPRYTPSGMRDEATLVDPGPRPKWESFALGALVAAFRTRPERWSPDEGAHKVDMESGAFFRDTPDFMREANSRTEGALIALRKTCAGLGAELAIVPIPNKASIEPRAKTALEDAIMGRSWKTAVRNSVVNFVRKLKGEPPLAAIEADPHIGVDAWSPDIPVQKFLSVAKREGITAFDARAALREAFAKGGEPLYYERDWHFNPAGNRAFARFVHGEIDEAHIIPPQFAAVHAADLPMPPQGRALPGWVVPYCVLLAILSVMYALTYRDESAWLAPFKVGALLALIFAIAIGGNRLLGALPPSAAAPIAVLFVIGVLGFVLYKLGRRLATIAELFAAFVGRGHWYLMPLVVVLLSVGSLLVVAASSPLVAPFIYTLF
jgi:hypothetical protein